VYFAAKKLMRHRAADQRRRDIIEKTRKNPDHPQQNKPPFPIVRKKFWQRQRQLAFFEMLGQQRKAHQKT
jgi:hypothetical protein